VITIIGSIGVVRGWRISAPQGWMVGAVPLSKELSVIFRSDCASCISLSILILRYESEVDTL